MKNDMPPDMDFVRFGAARRDADEVLRLRNRAKEIFASRDPLAFDGFGDLLDQVLPRDVEMQERICRALRMRSNQLGGLRDSELDPAGLPHEPLAMLGQAIALDLGVFMALVERDHSRFKNAGNYAASRDLHGRDPELEALKQTWDRLTMDEGSDY